MIGKQYFFVLLAALLWGTTGTAQKFAPDHASPVIIGSIRLAIGGLALVVYVLIKRKLSFKDWPFFSVAIAAIGMAAYQPLFFTAITITGVSVGTIITIGSAPILAGLLEWIINRNPPTRNWWISTFLAITGCLLLTLNGDKLDTMPLGICMAIGAGLSFAIYTLASKQLLKHHPPEAVVGVIFTISALMLIPTLFIYDITWIMEPASIFVSLHLGLLATALAYLFFAWGLSVIPASTAVTLSLAEPLTAALLGVLIVGELLTPISWLGVALLLFSLGLLSIKSKNIKRYKLSKFRW